MVNVARSKLFILDISWYYEYTLREMKDVDQALGFSFCMQFCTQQMEWVTLKYIRIIRNLQHKVRIRISVRIAL